MPELVHKDSFPKLQHEGPKKKEIYIFIENMKPGEVALIGRDEFRNVRSVQSYISYKGQSLDRRFKTCNTAEGLYVKRVF